MTTTDEVYAGDFLRLIETKPKFRDKCNIFQ